MVQDTRVPSEAFLRVHKRINLLSRDDVHEVLGEDDRWRNKRSKVKCRNAANSDGRETDFEWSKARKEGKKDELSERRNKMEIHSVEGTE